MYKSASKLMSSFADDRIVTLASSADCEARDTTPTFCLLLELTTTSRSRLWRRRRASASRVYASSPISQVARAGRHNTFLTSSLSRADAEYALPASSQPAGRTLIVCGRGKRVVERQNVTTPKGGSSRHGQAADRRSQRCRPEHAKQAAEATLWYVASCDRPLFVAVSPWLRPSFC